MKALFAFLISSSAFASGIDCADWRKSLMELNGSYPLKNVNEILPQYQLRIDRRKQTILDDMLRDNHLPTNNAFHQINECSAGYGIRRVGFFNDETSIRTTTVYEWSKDQRTICRIQVSIILMEGYNEQLAQGFCNGQTLSTAYRGSSLGILLREAAAD